MRRKSYIMEIEGHAVVRDQVLEDVRLAQVVKRAGVSCRKLSGNVEFSRSIVSLTNGNYQRLYQKFV